MKKVFVILCLLFTFTLTFAQKNVFENTQLVFEDDRKTFAIYACWNLTTYIDKGQYGDEHNVFYNYVIMYRVINKNDKQLRMSWHKGGFLIGLSFFPYEDCYITNGINSGLPNLVKTFDYKTGKMTFEKPQLNFRFEDSEWKPVKGRASRDYVKLGDSNLE